MTDVRCNRIPFCTEKKQKIETLQSDRISVQLKIHHTSTQIVEPTNEQNEHTNNKDNDDS